MGKQCFLSCLFTNAAHVLATISEHMVEVLNKHLLK